MRAPGCGRGVLGAGTRVLTLAVVCTPSSRQNSCSSGGFRRRDAVRAGQQAHSSTVGLTLDVVAIGAEGVLLRAPDGATVQVR